MTQQLQLLQQLLVRYLSDPTLFTAFKAAVGAKPNSTTTITVTPRMMTLVGVTLVSQQQPIKNQRHWISILQWEFGAVS